MDALCTDRPVGRFWNNWIRSTIRACESRWVLSAHLLLKVYIQYLKTSCEKALDIFRVVGHTDWGANRIVLLRLYRSLIRSKLDYGCTVYGSARRSVWNNWIRSTIRACESRWVLSAHLLKVCIYAMSSKYSVCSTWGGFITETAIINNNL